MLHRITKRALLKALVSAERQYLTAAVASALSSGKLLSTSQLIEAVYGHCYEPEYAWTNIKIAVMRLRKRGFAITTECSRGYVHRKAA